MINCILSFTVIYMFHYFFPFHRSLYPSTSANCWKTTRSSAFIRKASWKSTNRNHGFTRCRRRFEIFFTIVRCAKSSLASFTEENGQSRSSITRDRYIMILKVSVFSSFLENCYLHFDIYHMFTYFAISLIFRARFIPLSNGWEWKAPWKFS